jgi:putative ABC transport system permease protein
LPIQVKAVDDSYPLRGEFSILTSGVFVQCPPGKAFVSTTLKNKPVSKQPARLPPGDLELDLSDIIEQEPDRDGNLFQFAPRIMVNRQDALNSGLPGTASRARYRLTSPSCVP